MHEVGLMVDALRRAQEVAQQAGAHRIERLTFAIVPGGHVTPDVVETLFAALSPGTLAAGAALSFERRAGQFFCSGCGTAYQTHEDDPRCPSCGAQGVLDHDVDDLVLVSVDVDG